MVNWMNGNMLQKPWEWDGHLSSVFRGFDWISRSESLNYDDQFVGQIVGN